MCLWNLCRKRVLWLFQFTMRVRTSRLGASFGYFSVLNGFIIAPFVMATWLLTRDKTYLSL